MATVDSKGMVRGSAGPMVYRKYRNKNIIQSKPRKFKQTSGSIRASTEFGLSSSTAAIIRSAFQPAYLHRDGEAAARSTQLVYRSIRNSLNGAVGQRDLHDGDLSFLRGMEFNKNSALSKVLQVSHRVERNEQGRIVVSLGAIKANTDIRVPAWLTKSLSRYRIRLSLIGFNFRQEYYEYLEFRDIEIGRYEEAGARQIVFDTDAPKDQLLLLSMTLQAYSGETRYDEGILLNSREFSPCALIGAFAAQEPGELPGAAMDLDVTAIPEQRLAQMVFFGYEGNRLIWQLAARIKQMAKKPEIRQPSRQEVQGDLTGKRVSFKK